jgi:CMP-N,N'-diacetyllegionaminic acid synthase
MKILVLIPARGGSKRLPDKNIRLLGGSPLIVWSINAAKNVPEICDILVSTDSEEIADISRNAGATVPWLRPSELATDSASSTDVCLHALEWYENNNGKVDGLLLLQPTSPFRSRDSILRGIEIFRLNKHCSVIGVSLAESHPMWCFKIEGGNMRPFIKGDGLYMRSQDLSPAYVINGSLYLISPEELQEYRSFFKNDMVPLVIDALEECVDIDTQSDWRLAEEVLEKNALRIETP